MKKKKVALLLLLVQFCSLLTPIFNTVSFAEPPQFDEYNKSKSIRKAKTGSAQSEFFYI